MRSKRKHKKNIKVQKNIENVYKPVHFIFWSAQSIGEENLYLTGFWNRNAKATATVCSNAKSIDVFRAAAEQLVELVEPARVRCKH